MIHKIGQKLSRTYMNVVGKKGIRHLISKIGAKASHAKNVIDSGFEAANAIQKGINSVHEVGKAVHTLANS
jgi:hypothetical protein